MSIPRFRDESIGGRLYGYDNPRVSTDVLMLMLSHAAPDRRGLSLEGTAEPLEVWSFSADYADRALDAVRAIRNVPRRGSRWTHIERAPVRARQRLRPPDEPSIN